MIHKFNLIFIFIFLIGIGFVNAVECNADLSQGGNNCTVSSSLTLNGTYIRNMNGTLTGALQLSTANVILDCNNTKIFGNSTNYGIRITNNNITVKNCIIYNYSRGFDLSAGNNDILINVTSSYSTFGIASRNNDNLTINFSYIYNFTNTAIEISTTATKSGFYFFNNNIFSNGGDYGINFLTGLSKAFVLNNYFQSLNYKGLYLQQTNNSLIINNTFVNSLLNVGGRNISVINNSFLPLKDSIVNDNLLALINADNCIVSYNYIYNSTNLNGITLLNVTNSLISFNTINLTGDVGMSLKEYVDNITILNNTFINNYLGGDTYYSSINAQGNRLSPRGFKNVFFENNNFIDFGCLGMSLRNFNNLTIKNNFFSYNLTKMLINNVNCVNEPITAILIQQVYQGYVPEGTPSFINYTDTSIHNSSNVFISGNVFNNIPILLRSQNTFNLNQDLDSYWFKSFRIPQFMDRDDFYISNSFDNLTTINPIGVLSNILQQGRNNKWWYNYSIFRDYYYFKRINETYGSELILYNQSSALFTNGTSICTGSNSNLALNTGNINITLNPGEGCWIYDNVSDFQVDYNYTYNSNDQNGYSTNTNFISSSIVLMVANFFSLTPVLGTILGISILIIGIIGLILYIRKFNNQEQEDTIYT
jgi:hypothetical protein